MAEPDTPDLDELIPRLRERVADPARRVDSRPSQLMAGLQSLDLGGLFGMLQQGGADLRRLVAGNQAGRPPDDLVRKADAFGRAMNTPVDVPLPPPATADAVIAAEVALGFSLPDGLRRVYLEVADGGWGPGTGLLPVGRLEARYRSVRDEVPRTQSWPDRLLPLVDDDPVLDCLDASRPDGAVITWDPEDLGERAGDRAWRRSFSEAGPSLVHWLAAWVVARTPEEERQELLRQSMVEGARRSRAHFAAMTPEERAAYGFPEVGWEQQIAGGLGMDEGDETPGPDGP